ncbi:FAD-dependent monooxygenase [Amycolatopsis sp. WGS_07]|uniref:FAD-dependent monooxygenase n=1 Tax=Amycolatopsis sp. WGS_07 TaxID=3076764 RepID=UPI003873C06F
MHDVVIAGAGPVGLFLAGELALAGSSVLVLEKESDPHSAWRTMPLGMRGLSTGSVEAFYRRGILPALLAESGLPPAEEQVRPRSAGHFAGIALDPANVDVPYPAFDGIMTSLDAVETVLAERAVKFGAEIRRGVEVSGLVQDDDGVVVQAGQDEYPARWLVGCDGGRSAVRRFAGFSFDGTEPQLTGYAALATIADPEKLNPGFTLTPNGMYLTTPMPGHFGVMDFDGGAYDRSQPPTREHLQAVLRRVSGTDVTLDEVQLASSFTDRAKQTTEYRRGRVLLAGDAAHIHSPLGGQGLNLGIGDAMNLGWKLAATVGGHAPDGLLDTYFTERHPVGAKVLDWSRAQVAVMRPDPHSRAIQAVTRDLLSTRDGTTYVFARTSGRSLSDELVGHSAPNFRLADGTRLGELLHDGQGVALDFTADDRLRDTAARYRVQYQAIPARDDLGYDALLIRPDGVVAWASGHGSFEDALSHWFWR